MSEIIELAGKTYHADIKDPNHLAALRASWDLESAEVQLRDAIRLTQSQLEGAIRDLDKGRVINSLGIIQNNRVDVAAARFSTCQTGLGYAIQAAGLTPVKEA